MKSKDNKKKIVFAIAISILIVIAIVVALLFNLNKKSTDTSFFDYPETERKSIENCKSEENCDIWNIDYYDKLVLEKKYDVLEEKIDKINKDTEEYYNMVKKSDVNSSKCSNVKDMYNYSKRVVSNYANYENKKYLSVSVGRILYDLCEGTMEPKQIEVYIYDKNDKKIISQDEFKTKEKISDDDIYAAIKKTIKIIKNDIPEGIKLEDKYDDTVLFLDNEGNISVSFYVKVANAYYTATVRDGNEKGN